MELILLLWLSTIFISGWLANKKGYSAFEGVLWAIFIGPFEILVILFIWKDKGSKKCPQCAEMVKKEAKVCRFCGYKFEMFQTQKENIEAKEININQERHEEKSNIKQKFNKKYVAIFIILLGVFTSGYYYRYKIIYFVVDKVYDKLLYIGIELPYKIQLANILDENAYKYFSLANNYDDSHKYDEAIENYTKAIQVNPKYTAAYVCRGINYCAKNLLDEGIKDFSKAIELSPKKEEYYYVRGLTYCKKGLDNLCLSDWKEAANLGHEEARKSLKKYYNIDY